VSAGFFKGWSKTTRTMDYMNTRQYIIMRNEALKNDGVVPDATAAPDLIFWDTIRSTNWKKEIAGNTADIVNAQVGVTGGTKKTSYSLNTGYYSEGTVLPGNNKYTRGSVSLNVSSTSEDNKFTAVFSSSYTLDDNNLASQDLTSFVNLPPNMYSPYDSLGRLRWSDGGFSYGNPFSILRQPYNATSERLIANGSLNYKILPKISIRSNFSYNTVQYDQYSTIPISSQNPAYNPQGYADFNNTKSKTWNIEPQLDYNTNLFSKGTLQLLVGTTWQQKKDNGIYLNGSGYTNDAQITSIAGASSVSVENDYSLYRFSSVYGRLNYNWAGRYLVNFVARQDASSRFGTGNRIARFSAVGAAWIFSSEKFIQEHFPALSFGKLRASFGTTGNDRIGDYQYLDSWGNTINSYQGQTGLRPLRLYNGNYGWEEIKKIDLGLDLSFLKERISVAVDFFRHRSTNQLISYSLPDQTGFTSVIRNIPAIVQNKGIEILFTTINLKGKNYSWKSSFNLTVQRNKLLEFSGLATSNYASRYMIGKPINIFIGYTYLGVDPLTGIYKFDDKNKDGVLNNQDYSYQGTTDPDFFGGFNNIIQYKNIEFSFLFEFRKQMGSHAIFGGYGLPGTMGNQPLAVLDRWQNPGDVSTYQKFTQSYGTPASDAASLTSNSSAALTDASFIRLKTLAVYYTLPQKLLKRIKAESCKFYLQGQNLLTFTRYVGADPENQNLQFLPPLKVLTAGINIIF
jgi:TonB-linked SusC/RagA family outer membrane protein